MNEPLRVSILKTLAFFDIFDYPLTSQELHTWLWSYEDFIVERDFLKFLDSLKQNGELELVSGYVVLPGRGAIVHIRQQKIWLLEKKMEIARKGIRKLRWVPFVRAVFVCNTLAFAWPKKDSDIDVFIVTKAGRLWISRFLVSCILSLFGLRRGKTKIQDKLCLSFYVTDNALDISDLVLEEADIYLVYWLARLLPVYDPSQVYSQIMDANVWIKKYLSQASFGYRVAPGWIVPEAKAQKRARHFFEVMWEGKYGNFLEDQARSLQRAKMSRNTNSVQNEPDTRVVINDSRLKFHENDRRAQFKSAWEARCGALGV
ncbi:MAG: hypothetical protein HYY51_04190 [Candidatus Magasanikbacteria bacterium]|nr:hypothetical protein [Candidatus Magasanikbacteria bacterium]